MIYKKGHEELEMWLSLRLSPKIDFEVYEFDYCEGKHISMYRIPAAINIPVEFTNTSYILKRKAVRVIVYKGKNKFETEREQMFSKGYALAFENMIDWIKGQL